MKKSLLLFVVVCFIAGSSSLRAQDSKFEIYGLAGYNFSEGVNIDPQEGDNPQLNRISPKSAFTYDVGMDVFLSENFSIGFNFGQERSKLRVREVGVGSYDVADMDVNNYHGIFTYNFGDEDSPVRPFIFGGLGATSYSPGDIQGTPTEGFTEFSTTWGGGVKLYALDHFGFRGGVRWTPTYIYTNATGIWCNPWYWGCYVVGNSNYSHQFEITGGVVFRY